MTAPDVHYVSTVTGADYVSAIVDAAAKLAEHRDQEDALRERRDDMIRQAVAVMRPEDGRRTLSHLNDLIRREIDARGLSLDDVALSYEALRKIARSD